MMSAPLSSAAPAGTGMTASQVTATVVKFRCLYTHDLRRKTKRWQDGYLRYHTFNKRIMAYDCQGNFIGDHHWRSGDEVQDGDELELDRGALVQVAERIGSTQTDLTNLFEKKKLSQGSPQSKDPGSQPPRIAPPVRSSGSSQSRSLNDMLGIKKTPIAHLMSPYEERHPPQPEVIGNQSPDRAPKRQKISQVEQGNTRRSLNAQLEVVDLTQGKDTASANRPPTTGPSTRRMLEVQKDIGPNELPPSDEDRSKSASTATRQINADPLRRVGKTQPPRPTSSTSRPIPEAPLSATEDAKSGGSHSSGNNMPPPSRSFSSMASSDAPTNTLRMVTQKPRKKLVYKALLPDEVAQNSSTGPRAPLSKTVANNVDSLTDGTITQGPKQTGDEFVPSMSTQSILEQMIVDSEKQPPPTTHRQPHTGITEGTASVRQRGSFSRSTNILANRKANPAHSSPVSSVPLLDRPRNIRSSATTAHQELSMAGRRLQPVSGPLVGIDGAAEAADLRVKRSLDAPLRKAISDPTALGARPNLQPRPTLFRSSLSAVSESEVDQEEGPWTSEALDLFDFWPPGRPKPG